VVGGKGIRGMWLQREGDEGLVVEKQGAFS
jgi:hypothetical protein